MQIMGGSIKNCLSRVPGLHRLNRLGMNRMKRILGIEKNEENRKGCPPRQPLTTDVRNYL